MGIRELNKFIESCGVLVSYDNYRNQYVTIDAFQKIYKYCVIRDDAPPVEQTKIFNKHLRAIMNCINQLISFNIIPIFVFDGLSIASKAKNKAIIVNSEHETNKCIEHNTRKQFKISPQQIRECEQLLEYIGLPCIRAPYEADSQCAAITMCLRDSNTVITDDTDALVFGSRSVLRMLPMKTVEILRTSFRKFLDLKPDKTQQYCINDIFGAINNHEALIRMQRKVNTRIMYSYDTISRFCDGCIVNFAVKYDIPTVFEFLKENANKIRCENNMQPITEFTHKNFMEMCILFGTDYQPRILKMHVNEIFKLFVLSDFNINTVIDNTFPSNYIEIATNICDYYTNASVIDPTTIDVSLYRPMNEKLYNYLKLFGFSHSFTVNNMNAYNTNYNHFFSKSQ